MYVVPVESNMDREKVNHVFETRPLVSVIVPVYNVEKYLRRCVHSITDQTYKNLEIILIDDGAQDKSGLICDELEKEDNRIKVIHKKNGGLSSARNAGIEIATGDYITFVDSDDWIADDTYEYCMILMKEYAADVVEFNYKNVTSQENIRQPEEVINIFTGKEILQHYMITTTKTGSYSVCRCLFPREAIVTHAFREGKINEDIDYKYEALLKCNRLATTNQHKYFYFQSGNSLSCGGLKKKDFDLYEAANALYELTKGESFGTIAKLGEVKRARTAFSLLSKIAFYGIQDESIEKGHLVKMLVQEHRENVALLLSAPLPLSRKVLCIAFALNYSITEWMVYQYRKIVR